MAPHLQRDRNGLRRFGLFALAFLAAFSAFVGSVERGACHPFRSLTCFVDEVPAKHAPPADVPACPVVSESEIAAEGETELEDGGEYSWPSFGHDRACTGDGVVATSRADVVGVPRRFVDAADLSRSCRLTL